MHPFTVMVQTAADAPILVHFAATLAHRLRNPLAGISTATQLMHLQGQGSPLSDLMIQEVQRLDAVVEEMLHFADQPLEPPQELHLEAALLPLLPCDRTFMVEGLDPQLYVVCRPLELSMVLHTLLHYIHAVTPPQDPIYLSVDRFAHATEPHLVLRLAQSTEPPSSVAIGRTGWFGDELQAPGSSMGLSMVQTALLSYGLQLRAHWTESGLRLLSAELPITPLDGDPHAE